MAFFIFLRRLGSVTYLMQHPAVPRRLKTLPLIAFTYLIFPRDLIFDFRVLGVFDDVLVVSLLLGIFINKGWGYVRAAEKEKSDAIDAEFKVLMRNERGDDAPGAKAGDDPPAPPNRADDGTPYDDLRRR